MRFALGRTVARFDGDRGVRELELDDGSRLEADLVVVGVGVTPATGFVANAAVNDDGSLDVDDELRVNDHGVWAAGDVARYPEPHVGGRARIEHWRLAEQLGRAAAASMAGQGAPFDGVPGFWTQQFGLRVAYVGVGRGWDATFAVGDVAGGDFTVFFARGDELVAAAGTRDLDLAAFAELMRLGRLPRPGDLRRPRRGRPRAPASGARPAATAPDDATKGDDMTLPTRPLGTSGLEITTVGLGTWAIGGGGWIYGWGPQDDEQSLATMHRAVELGINWFDTAGVYGHGHSEEVCARFLREVPDDRRPLVFTKCGPTWDERDPFKDAPSDLSPANIRRQCDDSLRRLGVERLDLLQFHWPDDGRRGDRRELGRDGAPRRRGQGPGRRREQLRPRPADPLRGHPPRRFAAAGVLADRARHGRRGASLGPRARHRPALLQPHGRRSAHRRLHGRTRARMPQTTGAGASSASPPVAQPRPARRAAPDRRAPRGQRHERRARLAAGLGRRHGDDRRRAATRADRRLDRRGQAAADRRRPERDRRRRADDERRRGAGRATGAGAITTVSMTILLP